MGIFSSINKSSEIKRISKIYLSNTYISDNSIPVATEIMDFLSKNAPFKDLLINDENFMKVDIHFILRVIKEFESIGFGPPHISSGHSPVVSAFFFPDTLYFLIIADTKKDNYHQLLIDIDDYFRERKTIFTPTIDPRL
jgi:hypothetical protein